jgi:uncharacterized protein
MTQLPPNDPVLKKFRAAVTEIYGDRVERVVLFGSRARGDAREATGSQRKPGADHKM